MVNPKCKCSLPLSLSLLYLCVSYDIYEYTSTHVPLLYTKVHKSTQKYTKVHKSTFIKNRGVRPCVWVQIQYCITKTTVKKAQLWFEHGVRPPPVSGIVAVFGFFTSEKRGTLPKANFRVVITDRFWLARSEVIYTTTLHHSVNTTRGAREAGGRFLHAAAMMEVLVCDTNENVFTNLHSGWLRMRVQVEKVLKRYSTLL